MFGSGGRKSDIRMYVRNGMEQQSSLTRRSTRNKKKVKKVTFNNNNNAGEETTISDENTHDEKEINRGEDIRSRNEINRKCESPNENNESAWKIPVKTAKTRGTLIMENMTKKTSVTENTFSILQDNDMEMYEGESYGKKG